MRACFHTLFANKNKKAQLVIIFVDLCVVVLSAFSADSNDESISTFDSLFVFPILDHRAWTGFLKNILSFFVYIFFLDNTTYSVAMDYPVLGSEMEHVENWRNCFAMDSICHLRRVVPHKRT